MKALLTALLVVFFASTAHAATKGRILTNGSVSMYSNGKLVNSFSSQGPLDENSLIACDGTCLVKMKGLSLAALDKTMFAVKESDDAINLYIEKGRINFAISDITRQFAFFTPDGYYVKTEGFISQASTANSVKGYLRVTDKGTEIGMEQGTMLAKTSEGTQKIGQGQAILLAMVDVPPVTDDCDDPSTAQIEYCCDDPETEEVEKCPPGYIPPESGVAGGGAGAGGGSGGGLGGGLAGVAGFTAAVGLAAGIIIFTDIGEGSASPNQ